MFAVSNSPKLHLSPFVLSTVMFDNSNSVGDQEGFLIGSTQKSVRREISDQSMFNTEEDLVISIYSCIPFGNFLSFYDIKGNINQELVDEFLGERKKLVVGWYRFRRNLVPYPSTREINVHKNLKQCFASNIGFGDEYFILGVLGAACFPTVATHTYDYAFYVQKENCFRTLGISLLNLGDTKTEYRGGSLSSIFVNSPSFDAVLSVPWDFTGCWQTEDAMQQMHKMLREKCDNLSEELSASETVNCRIEREVKMLDEELESLTMKEPSKETQDLENSPPEKVCFPFSDKNADAFGKRCLKDIIEINEEEHPIFGKYFPQNRSTEDPGTTPHFNFHLPPKKKIRVIMERNRILDHDYDLPAPVTSDDESANQKPAEVTDEESSDTCETGYLSSDTATVGNPDEDVQKSESESSAASDTNTSPVTVEEETPSEQQSPHKSATLTKSSTTIKKDETNQ